MAVFCEAMSFFFFLPLLSQKVKIDLPKIFHCLASPGKVSALALKNGDSVNKEKRSGGSYSKTFLPTSIVTFDTKEANFENDIASDIIGSRIKTPSSKSMILVSFCWKRRFIHLNVLTNLI